MIVENKFTLRQDNIDCSPKHMKDLCRFIKKRTLKSVENIVANIISQSVQLPPGGNRKLLKMKGSYPLKASKAIEYLVKKAKGLPTYAQNNKFWIDNVEIVAKQVQHRIFYRAQGSSSAKKRQKVSVVMSLWQIGEGSEEASSAREPQEETKE